LSGVPEWFDHPDLIEYYATHRNRAEELYPSERRFLPWLAARVDSVLDVGCGAGGFSAVWRSFHPTLRYTGVDISTGLIEAARQCHPEHRFLRADCVEGLPLEDRFADVAVALGWLHWERDYARALRELWRVAGRYLFFDLRLQPQPGPDTVATQRLALNGEWDGRTTVPYLLSSWPRVAELLLGLQPARILGRGYWGKPADTVTGVDGEVCFATFVLERPGAVGETAPEVALDLPLQWPEQLGGTVELIGPEGLAELAPDGEALAR
jgi:SAM-dependent methyltransferase